MSNSASVVGIDVGKPDGCDVLGAPVGLVGSIVSVGSAVGFAEGNGVGSSVGSDEGTGVGDFVGLRVGESSP